MIRHAAFAYAQARLQARHGMRPSQGLWLHLASARDLASYLAQAEHTALRPWVQGLQALHSSHALEIALRRRLRRYVDEVSAWQPGPWRAAVHWTRHLPDLPALEYLLRGGAPYEWMQEDPALKPFTAQTADARSQSLQAAGLGALAQARERGELPVHAWRLQWRRLWPSPRRVPSAGLVYLDRLLVRCLQTPTDPSRWLRAGLTQAFRSYAFTPAAACAHLGLVALDLGRLRAELLQRALFAERAAETAA